MWSWPTPTPLSYLSIEWTVMGENIVKGVLRSLDTYLREHLPVDFELSCKLYGWKPHLISSDVHDAIRAYCHNGRRGKAYQEWCDYAEKFYNEDLLNKFCACLKAFARDSRPALTNVANKIEAEIREQK